MKNKIRFSTIKGNSREYVLLVLSLGFVSFCGFVAAWLRYTHGHYITNMTNAVPWGFPKIVAIYMIGLSAGSLVLSSLSGVFGITEFKIFARSAALLAALLLIGALMSIILDWGRPDRILVPFVHINPRSMFSLDAMFYTAYILTCFVYLWAMFKEKTELVKRLGVLAIFIAILVHSGTGAIFGFVGARELYHSPLLPPLFIASALSSGSAMMVVVMYLTFRWSRRPLDDALLIRLGSYMAAFLLVAGFFIFVENVTRAYFPANYEVQRFLLTSGNKYSQIFWVGMVGIGVVLPLGILFNPATRQNVGWILFASALVLAGVLAERYIIVIPAQVFPIDLFPGMKVSSPFMDGVVAKYSISVVEAFYGLGIFTFVFFLYALALKFFELLPEGAEK
ncbi:MAG: polysulfide reductase NrfD [Nitrospinae bacterium]|nr:polysulfide reductase NrfD [Nitrospinota bacterium]